MPSRPLQLALLEGDERRVGGFTPSLIAQVAPMYLTGSVLDVTYGRGMWWRNFTPALFGHHDIELDGVDFRSLPEFDASWDTVCFDPPYVPRHGTGHTVSEMDQDYRDRYGLNVSRNAHELWELIGDGLAECARVTRRWLLVKCCDYTNGRQFVLGHVEVLRRAEALGLVPHDLIVHASGPGPGGGKTIQPRRARRTHSYLWVFRKGSKYDGPLDGDSTVSTEDASASDGDD